MGGFGDSKVPYIGVDGRSIVGGISTVCPTKLVLVRIQKKNRVQENVIVEESSTITLTWTLFLRALQYSHIF